MSRTWKVQTEFVALSQSAVLNQVLKKSREAAEHGVIILDLDGTIFDVEHRTYGIVQELLKAEVPVPAYKNFLEQIAQVHVMSYAYEVRDTFHALIASMDQPHVIDQFFEWLKVEWARRFFQSEYLKYDQAAPGAVNFVQELLKSQVRLIYLTGRDAPNMLQGTLQELKRQGFPEPVFCADGQDLHQQVQLFMKPNFVMNDEIYKQEFVDTMTHLSDKIVAQFENEPLNVGLFQEYLPQAMHVFRDSRCSPREAKPLKGIYKIKDFNYVPTSH